MVQKFFKTLAVSALIAAGFAAQAQIVSNGSFEVPTLADGAAVQISATPSSGWDGGPNSSILDMANLGGAIDGDNVANLLLATSFASQALTGLSTSEWRYQVDFWAQGEGSLEVTGAVAPALLSFSSGAWQHYSLLFKAASSNATIKFNGAASSGATFIDSVAVSAVPEPEGYAMLLAGLGAVGFMSRRRRAS